MGILSGLFKAKAVKKGAEMIKNKVSDNSKKSKTTKSKSKKNLY